MKNYRTILEKFFFIIVVTSAFTGCFTGDTKQEVYSVALRAMPSRLDPWENPVNIFNIILDHVYFPLLYRDSASGDLRSFFLDMERTKALSEKLDEYRFCLKEDARFSDNSVIQTSDLAAVINHVNNREILAQKNVNTRIESNCVVTKLKTPDPLYLDRFVSVSSTVLKSSTIKDQVPVGSGMYKVTKFKGDEVVLSANSSEVKYFKEIIFKKELTISDAIKDNLMDLNHLYLGPLPTSFTDGKRKVVRPALKSYALVINYPDRNVRLKFAKCFPVDEFRKVTGLDLEKTAGFLPKGILGGDVDFKETIAALTMRENCQFKKNKPDIIYYNYNPALSSQMVSFFKGIEGHIPLHVSVKTIDVEEFVRRIYSHEKMISQVGFDSSGTEAAAFGEPATYFEPFLESSPNTIVKHLPDEFEENVRSGVAARTSEEKEKIYARAHKKLLETGYVVPLGELIAVSYFQNNIDNIEWSDLAGEFPRIDLMTSN